MTGTVAIMRDLTEIRKIETDFRESEAIIRSILETTGNVILFLAPDNTILEFNRAGESLCDCRRLDVTGQNFVEWFVPEDQRERFVAEMKSVMAGNSSINFESAVISSRGIRHSMLWNANRFYDKNGQPKGTIVIGQDITERKNAEEELRHSEERFRLLISSVNDFVFTMNRDLQYTGIYGGLHKDRKFNFDRYIGKTPDEIFGKKAGKIHLDATQKALKGETVQFEWMFCTESKRKFYFNTVLSPLKDYDDNIVGVVGIRRDITESKTAEKALQESETQLRSIVETAVDAIVTINELGIIESTNSAVEKMFGFSSRELHGKSINLLMPLPYSDEHDNFINQYLKSGNKKIIGIGREVLAQRKDGTSFPISLSVSEFFLGEKRMFTGIIHDISEQKSLQQKILQSERLAIIGKMAAKVAHEVRNPLSSISLNAELLGDEINGQGSINRVEANALLTSMIREIDRVTSLTDEYLQFSRLPEAQPEPGSVCDLIQELLESVEIEAVQRKIKLNYNRLKLDCTIRFDKAQIRRVLLNLFRNAFEAMPKGGVLNISTERNQDNLVITVQDNGIGIPEDMVGNIFNPFFTTKDFGTGLGLAISQQIILEHNGKITCKSDHGTGTVFRIELPGLTVIK